MKEWKLKVFVKLGLERMLLGLGKYRDMKIIPVEETIEINDLRMSYF